MIGVPCPYRKDRHIVIHPPLEGWLRRNVPDRRVRDDLFVYYSLDGQSFVVGLWADKRRSSFFDVLNMGPVLHFSWEDGMHFRRLFGDPLTRKDLARRSREEYMNRVYRKQDEAAADSDLLRWCNKTSTQVLFSHAN